MFTAKALRTCAAFAIAIALALAGVATPSFAQTTTSQNRQAEQRDARTGSIHRYGNARAQAGDAREQAIHDCTALERKTTPPIRDSNSSMFVYRTCMNDHGQPE
jgi:hypothetical protein